MRIVPPGRAELRRVVVAVFALIGAGCSGGSDAATPSTPSAPSTPAATVSISTDRSDVAPGAAVVVTWSSTNATSCTASGLWSGVRTASGNESVPIAKAGSLQLTCNGSGGNGSAAASITTIASTFALPRAYAKWRADVGDIDGDGEQEVLLPTMDSAGIYVASPATPMYVLGVTDQRVVNKTPALFPGGAPTLFSGRVFLGDFDGDGRADLMTCDRGREVGHTGNAIPQNSPNLVLGDKVSQNRVYLQLTAGVLTDKTSVYPQVLQDSWGCSTGDVDKSGRASIVQTTFGAQQGYPQAWLARWNGSAFVKTRDLVPQFPNAVYSIPTAWGFSATADFDKNGYADVVGLNSVLWGDANGGQMKALAPSTMDLAGYTFHRGSLVADFNGDGYPDLVTQAGVNVAPTFGEARFALYLGGPSQTLTEKVGAFPSVASYGGSDFGNQMGAIDVNFDGYLDIVTEGHVYAFSGQDQEPRAVWINNGSGTFTKKVMSDELEGVFDCTATQSSMKFYEVFYLKTKDPKAYNLVMTGCMTTGAGGPYYVARRVTPQYPVKLAP